MLLYKMSKRYMSVACSNGGNGVYGFSSGTPILRFDLANRGILQTQELRLQGQLFIKKISDNSNLVNPATAVNIDGYTGVQGAFQTLTLSSRAYSSRNLEEIQNYPRLCSQLLSSLHSKSGYDTHLYNEQGSKGFGYDTQAERSDTGRQYAFNSAGQLTAQRRRLCYANGMPFDCRLVCGMMMSNDIDLETLGGLSIVITLAPDSNFLWGSSASEYRYEIHNPRIICPIIEKTPQQQVASASAQNQVVNFLSFTSLYNTLTSTDQQIVHRVSLRGVISSFQSYVPTSYVNNYAKNGLGQYNSGIQKLLFHKDAKRFPLEYTIEVDRQSNVSELLQPTTNPQVLANYLDAFRNWRDVKKSSVNPMLCDRTHQVLQIGVFGTGCSYDAVSQSGIPAVVSTLGLEIQSTLDDPASPSSTTPYSIYSYYLVRNAIQINQGVGINVVS